MKRFFMLITVLISVSSMANIKAVCTLPWIGSVLGEIAKEKVDITTLVKPDEDPHYAEPKPSMLLAARKADLLFYNGLDLEIGYLPRIIESSSNPRIQAGKDGNIDLSQFVTVIEKPATVDRSMGDIHPLGNPHYNFSPKNIKEVAKGMAMVLGKADPSNASYYRNNLEAFLKRLSQKEAEWRELSLKGKNVITYHKLFEYLAGEYGFKIIAYIEPKPGIPPSAKHLSELLETLRSNKVDLIITTNVIGEKEANYLSKDSGVKAVAVPQDVGGSPEAKDWFALIDTVLKTLGEK
jgi:zinc/manganese transport system substrate-binding protein